MTNNQAQAYAIIAIENLIDAGIITSISKRKTIESVTNEIIYLMGMHTEGEAEKRAQAILDRMASI